MIELFTSMLQWNMVTIVLALIVLFSIWEGVSKGASGSMRHLFFIMAELCLSILTLFGSYQVAIVCSPWVADWLQGLHIQVPNRELAWWENLYYSVVTSIRDFPLLRFTIVLLLIYLVLRSLVRAVMMGVYLLTGLNKSEGYIDADQQEGRRSRSMIRVGISRLIGAVVGCLTGGLRIILVVLFLFGYVTLLPDNGFSRMIQASTAYQITANRIVEPIAGEWISKKLPVFSAEVEKQLSELMQRKYEVIDNHIPQDIELAAVEITKDAATLEEKARKLYDWVGSRVTYDWSKANNYIDNGVWKEQTPQDTFDSRTGVCIDYARLYAVMARAAGLEVRVVTGLGYDGKGGYGPHAWNTVRINDNQWIHLDATWASTGDWFNPPNFEVTHVPDAKSA